MEAIGPAGKSSVHWRVMWLFLVGVLTGCCVVLATCFGGYIYASTPLSADDDFLTADKEYMPWYHDEIRLELQSHLSVDLPESTIVRRKKSFGWEEPWLSMVFQTSEAHSNELTALLDEQYPVMGAEDLVDLKSFGEGGVMTPPVRAWRLPKDSEVQILVVRLVEIRDGIAIWAVEDHLGN